MDEVKGLVIRSKKVAFMQCTSDKTAGTYTRMTKFTSMSRSANPNEYSRKYIDEDGQVTDVTGFSPSYAYAFDQYVGNKVHEDIIDITDNEKVGDDAVRPVLIVDFTQPGTAEGSYKARLREFSFIPDSDGDDANTYTYSGNMRSKSAKKDVEVTSTDNWITCTIASGE